MSNKLKWIINVFNLTLIIFLSYWMIDFISNEISHTSYNLLFSLFLLGQIIVMVILMKKSYRILTDITNNEEGYCFEEKYYYVDDIYTYIYNNEIMKLLVIFIMWVNSYFIGLASFLFFMFLVIFYIYAFYKTNKIIINYKKTIGGEMINIFKGVFSILCGIVEIAVMPYEYIKTVIRERKYKKNSNEGKEF